MAKILALFPGQGSQAVGMGKELNESYELARKLFARADQALGVSLSQICFEGPADRLTMTEIAQPAILTVSTIAFLLAGEELGLDDLKIIAGAGHSLGEYSALVAAGAIAFEDAVLLVHKRGRYMQQAVLPGVGRMLAVLGIELEELEDRLSGISSGVAEVANVNAPGQIVIAGDKAGIAQFIEQNSELKSVELKVSAPFHCSLMKAAEEMLRPDIEKLAVAKARFPIFANVTGASCVNPEEIRKNLIDQVCARVKWTDCMKNAISIHTPDEILEFGQGTVLSGLAKRIAPEIPRRNIGPLASFSMRSGAVSSSA